MSTVLPFLPEHDQARAGLPDGVRRASQVMPQVLAKYGLSLAEQPAREAAAGARLASFIDLRLGANECLVAS